MNIKPLIINFGSHRHDPESKEYKEAELLGKELAKAGFRVATGGYGGLMEAVLKGAGGGRGYTVKIFQRESNPYVTDEVECSGILARISTMLEDCAGVIVLQGGTGTLLELAAAWEMVNKKFAPARPIVCIGDFWKAVVETLSDEPTIDNIYDLKPMTESAASYIKFVKTPAEAAKYLKETLMPGKA